MVLIIVLLDKLNIYLVIINMFFKGFCNSWIINLFLVPSKLQPNLYVNILHSSPCLAITKSQMTWLSSWCWASVIRQTLVGK